MLTIKYIIIIIKNIFIYITKINKNYRKQEEKTCTFK